ncbi:hypothetical protein E2C01_082745 [Portunus trituberculatus]|uniref:CCHC-type domain-containing protein n=1 Tax=Portunus trituberculatus TaxID=210409 RepID=A0A5B7IZ96_PORTR|nr:hypothetical protein [Portunus trituberculatus]
MGSMKTEVLRCLPLLKSFSDVVRVCEIIEAAEKASEGPSCDVGGVTGGDPPHAASQPSEVVAAGPTSLRPTGQGKHRQVSQWGRKRCTTCGECGGWRQCRAFAATYRCCGQKGHFWSFCPALTLPSGARATTYLSAPPTSGGDHWRSGGGIVITSSAVADTGAQVEDLCISQRQLQATPMAVTHVARGDMNLLGTIRCQVSVGTCSTAERIYIAEGVQ